jgi:Ca2+-binding RTX toxin-like protein
MDTAVYATAAQGVTVDLNRNGVAQILGTGDALGDVLTNIENVFGSGFDDLLIGTTGANGLAGGAGNDTIIGSGGRDTVDGGAGNDTLSYASYFTGVTVDLGTTGQLGTLDVVLNVENVIGSAFNDVIAGNSLANSIDGGGGVDTVSYATSSAGVVIALSNTGPQGSGGDGAGDILTGIENVTGSNFGDYLIGNEVGNVLQGLGGNDTLDGLLGADVMAGGAGNDVYLVDNAADFVQEAAGAGTDAVFTTVSYALRVGQAIESLIANPTGASTPLSLTGNELANKITGNSGANILNGGKGDDYLSGGAGNDKLYGNIGKDVMLGGAGKDFYYFNTSLNAKTNVDTIKDFSHRDDTIALENAVFKTVGKAGKLASSAFYTGSAAHDSNDRIIYNKLTGALFYDSDGTGAHQAIKFAQLSKGLALAYNDFIIT